MNGAYVHALQANRLLCSAKRIVCVSAFDVDAPVGFLSKALPGLFGAKREWRLWLAAGSLWPK